jgi:uncharacterized membrane protein SpoIIM required for sporulation/ABC-type transport system involved in multi-copper enzyme maturation permease subunit
MALDGALVITQREVRDSFTDWRTLTPMLVLALIFPSVVVAGIALGAPLLNNVEPNAAAEKVVPFGALMASFFPISFSLILALESFVGEKERNTLEALLAMPLTDAELFLGKLAAVLIPPIVLSLIGLSVYLFGLNIFAGYGVPPGFVALAILLGLAEALVMVSAAVVVSSHTTSVRAANLLASFIILPMALVVQAETLSLLFGQGYLLWFFLATLVVVALILVRTGIRVFNREQILARESDQLSLPGIGRLLLRFWRATPEAAYERFAEGSPALTPWRLVRLDIPQLFRYHRGPLALVAALLALGLIGGYVFAQRYPLVTPAALSGPLIEESGWNAVLDLSAGGIFLHNVRAIAIGAALSFFSFGSAMLVTLIIPLAIVGFFAGQGAHLGLNPGLLLLGLVAPHGVFEVPAAALAAAVSLRLGMTLMAPPRGYTVGEGLALALVNWLKMAIVFVPLFLVAALLEAHVTPRIALALLG